MPLMTAHESSKDPTKSSYWGSVASRAWREVRSEAPWGSSVRLVIWLSPLLAALLAWATFHSVGAPVPYAAGFTILIAMFFALLAVAWKVASIPPVLDRERVAKIAELESALAPISRKVGNPNDVGMEDALAFAIHGRWDNLPEENEFSPTMDAISQFEQFLANGLLRCWGRENRNHGPYRLLQDEYWGQYGLEPLDILQGDYKSKHKDGVWTGEERHALMFNRQEIESMDWVRDIHHEQDPRDDISKYVSWTENDWRVTEKCPLCDGARVALREGHATYKCGARLSSEMDTWFVAIPCQHGKG